MRFGPFEVNFERQELRKYGMRMKLEDKPFEILEALLQQPGKLVCRQELRAKLWPDTFVSYDRCLNTAVNKLRSALGDCSRSFRFVETVRRRGYRFVGPVENPPAPVKGHARHALLVLPFRTQPRHRSNEAFAEGLCAELSAEIGRVDPDRLGVIALTTAMLFKEVNSAVDQIGQKVGADLILEGSVRRAEERVRIAMQLVRVSDQMHLWSEICERPVADPFACQAEVAQLVVCALVRELGLCHAEAPARKPSSSPISLPNQRMRKLGS